MSRTVTFYCWRNLLWFISGFFFLVQASTFMEVLQKEVKKGREYLGLFEFLCFIECASWSAEDRVHTPCLTTVVFTPNDVCLKISNSKAFLLEWTVLKHLGKYFGCFCVALLNEGPIKTVASKNKLDLNYWNNCWVFVISDFKNFYLAVAN